VKLSATCERRMLDLAELRLDAEDEVRTIRGYAAVFDSMSQPLYGFREVIRKGAFKKSVRESDIRALWNHDPNYVLGRKSSRTLRLEEDEKGLLTRIFPPDTTWARDLMQSIERGDVSQMSFGFVAIKDRWLPAGEDGLPVRELLEARLFDVSPVTFPAYQQTEVHVRALMDSVISRISRGGVSREERQAMSLALRGLVDELDAEPGAPHSAGPEREPGAPHSETPARHESGAVAHSGEQKRTLLDRRRRLLELVTS